VDKKQRRVRLNQAKREHKAIGKVVDILANFSNATQSRIMDFATITLEEDARADAENTGQTNAPV